MIVAPSVLCQFRVEPPTRRQRGRAPIQRRGDSVGSQSAGRGLGGAGRGLCSLLRKNPPTRTQWLTRYVPVFRYRVGRLYVPDFRYACSGFCTGNYGAKSLGITVRSCTGIPVPDSVFCEWVRGLVSESHSFPSQKIAGRRIVHVAEFGETPVRGLAFSI